MRLVALAALLCLILPTGLLASDSSQPTFHDAITVSGETPLLVPVDFGQAVLVNFSIGELEISSADTGQVHTQLTVRCRNLSPERCVSYRERLQLVAETRDDQVSVRLAGLSVRKMRKLEVDGRIVVPRWAPLEVRMGIGELNIDVSGEANLGVRMRIGDLKIHVAEKQVSTVDLSVGIGDAGISGEVVDVETTRRKLLGARARWESGNGDVHIAAHLGIGDVGVVLE
jgi:predicted membrane protein